jgi:hypothetical protein
MRGLGHHRGKKPDSSKRHHGFSKLDERRHGELGTWMDWLVGAAVVAGTSLLG